MDLMYLRGGNDEKVLPDVAYLNGDGGSFSFDSVDWQQCHGTGAELVKRGISFDGDIEGCNRCC
jgi:hypothetical protein